MVERMIFWTNDVDTTGFPFRRKQNWIAIFEHTKHFRSYKTFSLIFWDTVTDCVSKDKLKICKIKSKYHLGVGETFRTKTRNLDAIKEKVDVFGYIKFLNIYGKKALVNKVNIQMVDLKKMSSAGDSQYIYNIYTVL